MKGLAIILLFIHIYGYITGEDGRSIEYATVTATTSAPSASSGAEVSMAQEVQGVTGATSNRNGYYEVLVDAQDTVILTYRMVGYIPVMQRLIRPGDVTNINVMLEEDAQLLEQVEVRGIKRQTGTLESADASQMRLMPDATGGSIESLLITFAGVSQNNELSSQYNVRGGSFDENVVYVNGIEVHRPLLIRSGQQEGLSFVNPSMVENVQFSAGGFDAKYGDKMSSVLDITYKEPQKTEAQVSASLLGANAYVGHGDSTFSQMHGIRYKTSKYMLGGLQTVGNYNPTYVDYQTMLSGKVGRETSHPWTLSLLGNVSVNTYEFRPDSMTENIGGMDNLKNLTIWYEGQEKDRFVTAFGALSARGKVSNEVEIGFDASGFYTNEREHFDIKGDYVLSEGDGSDVSNITTAVGEANSTHALATGTYMQHARNQLTAGVATLSHHGAWKHEGNTLEWGLSAQGEWIRDAISEWEMRDSAGYSMPNMGAELGMYYSMRGDAEMQSYRMQGYVQNTHRWKTKSGTWILTAGGRLQYWSYNGEWLPSPRASVTWLPGWKRDFAFRAATGLYYQAPFYKELRDTATVDGVTRITLNNNLRAQRSVHALVGMDYYFRGAGRPFKFSAEAYYKHIDRMCSYTVDNVRVRYSGANDAEGYSVGLDLKFYGELVPGADSWVSLSTMRSKMQLTEHRELGWLAMPQEQRWAFTMYFQDYFPRFPQMRFHLKMVFADGLPYSQPRRIERQYRTSSYKRIDLGASYVFDRKTAKFMRKESAKHVKQWTVGLEVFNIVGFGNVNTYFWATDANGRTWSSPNYLTGRRYNVKVSVDIE